MMGETDNMATEPKVAVLMSAYNGERFIEKQVDSVLQQEGVRVSLYARDDNSDDATMRILRTYASNNGAVHVFGGDLRMGPANSFMEILYHACVDSGASFFAFSDQDDVWKPDKLARAVAMIEAFNGPVLYCSNQTLFVDGVERGLRYDNEPNLEISSVLFANQVSGCTMVLNRALVAELSAKWARPDPDVLGMRMHDTWIMLAALALGDVVYDPESRIDYRIHPDNVVGTKSDGLSPLRRTAHAVSAILRGENVGYRSTYAAELARRFPGARGEGWSKVKELADYRKDLGGLVRLLLDEEMRAASGESFVEYTLKTLLGLF